MDGAEMNGGQGAEVPDEYMALLQRLEEAGWVSGGGIGPNGISVGFNRLPDSFDIGLIEATQKLDILDEDGTIRSGYSVGEDEIGDVLVVGYDGPHDEHFDKVVDEMVAWGEEMKARQETALEREEMLPWADDVADRLTRQVGSDDGQAHVDRIVEEAGGSREAAVATWTEIVLPSFVVNLEPALADKFLETLFARVVERQDELVGQTMAPAEGAAEAATAAEVRPEFILLEGIAQGVRKELARRHDAEAMEARRAAGDQDADQDADSRQA